MTRLLGVIVAALIAAVLLYGAGYFVFCKEAVQFGRTRIRVCESRFLRNIYTPAAECESALTGLRTQLVLREERSLIHIGSFGLRVATAHHPWQSCEGPSWLVS